MTKEDCEEARVRAYFVRGAQVQNHPQVTRADLSPKELTPDELEVLRKRYRGLGWDTDAVNMLRHIAFLAR